MMEIWGLKTCDTCRKAIKALPEARFRDVRAEPLSVAEIAGLVAQFPAAIVNRASTTWRGLSDAEKAQDPSVLLAAHPTLMKRPVVRTGDAVHLGWTPAVRAALGVP